MKKPAFLLACLFLAFFFAACSTQKAKMQDGYYTAEAAEFDEKGWKEYITIYVSSEKIVTVEYDAKNQSGFVKSWDMEYMRVMDKVSGTYPSQYSRAYVEALVSRQDPQKVDAVAGATTSYHSFVVLAQAAVNQALQGDKNVVLVPIAVSAND